MTTQLDVRQIESSSSMLVREAESFVIEDHDDAEKAGEFLTQIVTAKKTAKEFFRPAIEAAHETHKQLLASQARIVGPLEQAEAALKSKVGAFLAAEKRAAEEAARAARAAAEEIERKAQLAAEEAQRLARQAAEEAAAKARKAAETAANDAASKAAKERAEAAARAAVAEAEARARLAQEEAAKAAMAKAQSAVVVLPPAPAALTGVSQRSNWTCEVDDESKVPREFLSVDMKKLRAYAKAMRDTASVPGVRFYDAGGVAVRTA